MQSYIWWMGLPGSAYQQIRLGLQCHKRCAIRLHHTFGRGLETIWFKGKTSSRISWGMWIPFAIDVHKGLFLHGMECELPYTHQVVTYQKDRVGLFPIKSSIDLCISMFWLHISWTYIMRSGKQFNLFFKYLECIEASPLSVIITQTIATIQFKKMVQQRFIQNCPSREQFVYTWEL